MQKLKNKLNHRAEIAYSILNSDGLVGLMDAVSVAIDRRCGELRACGEDEEYAKRLEKASKMIYDAWKQGNL